MGNQYYEQMKNIARKLRTKHNIKTSTLGLAILRNVCKSEGITKIDYWKHKLRKVRAAYIAIDNESCILLNANIKPVEPRLFSLAHELKHHICDREVAQNNPICCIPGDLIASKTEIEVGAEVFAAEFIFPEKECRSWMEDYLEARSCTKEDVVHLKHSCSAKVSYTFLVKRLEWFNIIKRGAFAGIKFKKLEESMYGIPFYRLRYAGRKQQ